LWRARSACLRPISSGSAGIASHAQQPEAHRTTDPLLPVRDRRQCRWVRSSHNRPPHTRDDFRDRWASDPLDAIGRMAGQRKELPVEIINLGEADGLPPVDWAAVVDKLESGSAPAPDA